MAEQSRSSAAATQRMRASAGREIENWKLEIENFKSVPNETPVGGVKSSQPHLRGANNTVGHAVTLPPKGGRKRCWWWAIGGGADCSTRGGVRSPGEEAGVPSASGTRPAPPSHVEAAVDGG